MWNNTTDMCRICLTTSNLEDIFTEDSSIIAEKIMSCTSIQISSNDSLPTKICQQCILYLDIAYAFRTVCEWVNCNLKKGYQIKHDSKNNNSSDKEHLITLFLEYNRIFFCLKNSSEKLRKLYRNFVLNKTCPFEENSSLTESQNDKQVCPNNSNSVREDKDVFLGYSTLETDDCVLKKWLTLSNQYNALLEKECLLNKLEDTNSNINRDVTEPNAKMHTSDINNKKDNVYKNIKDKSISDENKEGFLTIPLHDFELFEKEQMIKNNIDITSLLTNSDNEDDYVKTVMKATQKGCFNRNTTCLVKNSVTNEKSTTVQADTHDKKTVKTNIKKKLRFRKLEHFQETEKFIRGNISLDNCDQKTILVQWLIKMTLIQTINRDLKSNILTKSTR